MRQKWIDFLKAIAMIAVLQNHLPQETRLYNGLYSIFSVSLFVLCGGMTAVISLENQIDFEYKAYFWKKVKQIIFPYFVATCGYTIYDLGYLDIFYMLNKLLNFSYGSNGHMYYLVFYFELILVAPILVRLYKKYEKGELIQMGILACSIILAYVFKKYTCLDKFALGSKYLFGGSYFFVFILGIYIYLHIDLLHKLTVKIIAIFMSIGAFTYIVSRGWCLAWWSNPPSVKVILYTIVVFLFNYSCFTFIQYSSEKTRLEGFIKFLVELFCVIGRYSLYIYLWHMILLDVMLKRGLLTKALMGVGEKLVINCFILYFPCLLCVLYRKGTKELRKCY